MTTYLLNSAVITAPEDYRYVVLPPAGPDVASAQDWARAWYLGQHPPPVSTIGYPQTAEALTDLLGVSVAVDRHMITMLPGDEALVFRLVFSQGRIP